MVLTTANDAPARDPASWEIYGTNDPIVSLNNSLGNGENWTLIANGAVALPDTRFTAGPTLSFANAASFTSYRVVFPTLKNSAATNSMQVADAQLFASLDASGTGILAAGNPALAVDLDVVPNSNYPAAEGPANLLDGNPATKYLNFGEINAGFIVTPSGGAATTINNFTITTANDAPDRDPAAWALYGSNNVITSDPNSRGLDESWTLIDSGNISLPMDRLTKSAPIAVEQSVAYSSFRMIFSAVRNSTNANSVQLADVQFDDVPEPASVGLLTVAVAFAASQRRRRK
jgi:hypothetical protein